MARKSKEEELDFFYINGNEKITSNKQKKKTKKKKSNKNSKNNNKTANNKAGLADNEIIIGVNTKPIEKTSDTKNNKSKKKKKSKSKTNNNKGKSTTKKKDKLNGKKKDNKKDTKKKKKNKILSFCIKLIIILVLFGVTLTYLITSPLFDISKVEILGSSKITADTYISLSGITIGNNIYDLSKRRIIENIKENPYVDTVEVKRKLPSTVEITVTERTASYMLGILNSYAYINNQGYILEINEEQIKAPVITGYSTREEEIVPGNRLNEEDLIKLEMVIKIMDTISVNGITEIVNEINIADKNNYTLIFSEEGKTVFLGDGSNLTDRIGVYLKAILQNEKGKSGEVFINGDLNQDKVFFREKV